MQTPDPRTQTPEQRANARAALACTCAAMDHGARQYRRDLKRRYIAKAANEWPVRRESMLVELGLEGRSGKRVAFELWEILREGGFVNPLARWVVVGCLTGELRLKREDADGAARIAGIFAAKRVA